MKDVDVLVKFWKFLLENGFKNEEAKYIVDGIINGHAFQQWLESMTPKEQK